MTIATGPADSIFPNGRRLLSVLAVVALASLLGPHAGIAATAASTARTGNPAAPSTVNGAPPCTPTGDLEPICGLQAPEDLVVLPGGGRLLAVQMHGPTHLPDSNVVEIDTGTRNVRVLPVRAAATRASSPRA